MILKKFIIFNGGNFNNEVYGMEILPFDKPLTSRQRKYFVEYLSLESLKYCFGDIYIDFFVDDKPDMYDASTLLFISSFESIRDVCNYLNLDYDKKNSAISNVCNRKQKTLMGKYVLRYASDDEFMKMDNV